MNLFRRQLLEWFAATPVMSIAAKATEFDVGETNTIPMAYKAVATEYGIPTALLYAVALTESGRGFDETLRPWPWVLNIAGRGIYYQYQAEAIEALQNALQNNQSVDIGLMQVNWRWHRQRFQSVERALTPTHNLRVGAEILAEHYQRAHDWWIAVGDYHSPGNNPSAKQRAANYQARVKQHWLTL